MVFRALLYSLPLAAALGQTALEKQRASVEKQTAAVKLQHPGFFLQPAQGVTPSPGPAPAAACSPMPIADIKPIVEREAKENGVNPKLVHAVIEAESAYQPCAVSDKGAMGLMQLMPATAESLGVTDPYEVEQNIAAGTKLLRDLLQRYSGDMGKALAAYNAGPSQVDSVGKIPEIPETKEYVRKILDKLKEPPRPIE